MKSLSTLLIGLSLASGIAQDNDPFAAPPAPAPQAGDPFVKQTPRPSQTIDPDGYNVGIFTEWIEVEPLALTEILQQDDVHFNDGDAVRDAVDALMKEERATLLDSCYLTGRHSQKCEVVANRELIYPTEFDRGETKNVKPLVLNGTTYWPPTAYAHPTQFETRYLGVYLQGSAKTSSTDHGVILSIAPEMVEHLGYKRYVDIPISKTKVPAAALPTIGTVRCELNHPIEYGSTTLLGSSPRNGQIVLTFATSNRIDNRHPEDPLSSLPGISATAEFIQVDAEWFATTMEAFGSRSLDGRLIRNQVQDQLSEGKATIIDIAMTAGQATNATHQSEGVTEIIYPTEYDPPQPSPVLDKLPSTETTEHFWPAGAYPTPTAFNTRNTGTTLKTTIDDLGETKGYLMDIVAESVRHQGETASNAYVTPHGEEPQCPMPLFTTHRVTSSLYVQPGEVLLLGAMTPRTKTGADREHRLLIFLRLAK